MFYEYIFFYVNVYQHYITRIFFFCMRRGLLTLYNFSKYSIFEYGYIGL